MGWARKQRQGARSWWPGEIWEGVWEPWRDSREGRLFEFLVELKPAEGVGASQGGVRARVWWGRDI